MFVRILQISYNILIFVTLLKILVNLNNNLQVRTRKYRTDHEYRC